MEGTYRVRDDPLRSQATPLHRALDLEPLCLRSHGEGVSIGCVFGELRERGYLLGLLILALPFVSPLPTLGLSAPVGFVAMLSGASLVLGCKPRVPAWISRRRLSHDLVVRLALVMAKAAEWAGRWVRPRWSFMLWPGLRQCIGLGLVSAGFILSLPLPIPFSNSIPAMAILLLCLGAIVEDGAIIALGHGVGLGAWVYLYAVGDVTWSILDKIIRFA
jgi:hypothetical protein